MSDNSRYTRHYRDEHHHALDNAKEYKHLLAVALEVLHEMPKPIGQVCGPISTGGLGSIEKNLEQFTKVVHKLIDDGHNIFNQMPFEKPMQLLRKSSKKQHPHETNKELFDEFYLPIFESGNISTMYFIPGWESSQGARWERETAERLGIKIMDLPKDFLEK